MSEGMPDDIRLILRQRHGGGRSQSKGSEMKVEGGGSSSGQQTGGREGGGEKGCSSDEDKRQETRT